MKDKILAEAGEWLKSNEDNYPKVYRSNYWLKQIIADYHEARLKEDLVKFRDYCEKNIDIIILCHDGQINEYLKTRNNGNI